VARAGGTVVEGRCRGQLRVLRAQAEPLAELPMQRIEPNIFDGLVVPMGNIQLAAPWVCPTCTQLAAL